MEEKDILFFTNNYYRVLLLIDEQEVIFQGKRFTPLLYEEIGGTLHCTRQTASKVIKQLIHNGYVKSLMKGRLQITNKGKYVIQKFKMEA